MSGIEPVVLASIIGGGTSIGNSVLQSTLQPDDPANSAQLTQPPQQQGNPLMQLAQQQQGGGQQNPAMQLLMAIMQQNQGRFG